MSQSRHSAAAYARRATLAVFFCAVGRIGAQTPSPDLQIDAPSFASRPAVSSSVTVYGNPNDVPKALIRAEAEREIKEEETQRIAVVVPNFTTVISGEGVPLDPAQKIDLAWHTAADPFNVLGAFVLGGASELTGSHKGFGWGPEGYAKRVGGNLADVLDGTMLAGAIYPILLHQDPRYFRKGTGSLGSRLRHAMAAPFLCRGDNGRTQPNVSNVLGNFSAGAISNLFYPDTGIRLTMMNSTIVTLEGSLGNIALEFSPDVEAMWRRHRAAKQTPVARSGPGLPVLRSPADD
ncbi:MAG: hypothetical protein NVSMB62_19450 [Acidobacteriaceae bacterium]